MTKSKITKIDEIEALWTMQTIRRYFGGRSRASIVRDVDEGRLPKPVKWGGANYWRPADVRAAVDAAMIAPD